MTAFRPISEAAHSWSCDKRFATVTDLYVRLAALEKDVMGAVAGRARWCTRTVEYRRFVAGTQEVLHQDRTGWLRYWPRTDHPSSVSEHTQPIVRKNSDNSRTHRTRTCHQGRIKTKLGLMLQQWRHVDQAKGRARLSRPPPLPSPFPSSPLRLFLSFLSLSSPPFS